MWGSGFPSGVCGAAVSRAVRRAPVSLALGPPGFPPLPGYLRGSGTRVRTRSRSSFPASLRQMVAQ